MYDREKLRELVNSKDVKAINDFMKENNLHLVDKRIKPIDMPEYKKQAEYYNLHQLIRKINLNSLYGCLLQSGSKFYDPDLGKSTTLTGRNITRHMTSAAVKQIINEYTHESPCVVINDTDSCYISLDEAAKILKKENKLTDKELVEYFDSLEKVINDSFCPFMVETFNVSEGNGNIIRCGRESVAESALLVSKKHYGMLVINEDGHFVNDNELGGKIKVRGLDELRSDSSKELQMFLRKVLVKILKYSPIEEVEDLIIMYKKEFDQKTAWGKGSPKSIRNISDWESKIGIKNGVYESTKILRDYDVNKGIYDITGVKVNLPGNAQAAINWNRLRIIHCDLACEQIVDGTRIIVMKLKNNIWNMKSVALPYDQTYLPTWFKELPFDIEKMTEAVLLKKVRNLTDVLGWRFNLNKNKIKEQFGDMVSYEY